MKDLVDRIIISLFKLDAKYIPNLGTIDAPIWLAIYMIWSIYNLNYLNKILDWLNRVNIKSTDDISKIIGYEKMLSIDEDERSFTEDYIHWVKCDPPSEYDYSMIPYIRWNDFICVSSYKDITYMYREEDFSKPDFKDLTESYSTAQIIEVFGKRKEYLARRNDPEQRKKMIEEYENSEEWKKDKIDRIAEKIALQNVRDKIKWMRETNNYKPTDSSTYPASNKLSSFIKSAIRVIQELGK